MAEQTDKDQKTEPATPRRRTESRKNGQVAFSKEIVAAMMLITGLIAIVLGGGVLANAAAELAASTLSAFGRLGTEELDLNSSSALVKGAFFGVLGPLMAVFFPAVLMGVLVGYGQVGFMITPKAVQVDGSKINPIKGASKLFSAKSLMRTVLAGAKVLLISSVMLSIAWFQLGDIARVGDSELGPILVALGQVALLTAAGGLLAILALAVVDLIFQRYQHEKDMRMSKQEIKEENRISEGDPHIKAKVRQIQREMATQRMMSDVPNATVIVTNPTHYAVALRYDQAPDATSAPRCVAKGKGHVARTIKRVGRESGVVLYEDVPLARALHAQVEVGQEIPEELYTAVAEVLSYVYRLQGRVAAA